MATWSRSQSQECGGVRAISSGIATKCSTHLNRDAKVMAANKRENARVIRWAEEAPGYTKVRKYNHTIEVKLSRKTVRRLGGKVLSAAHKAAMANKVTARKEFFASLGVEV